MPKFFTGLGLAVGLCLVLATAALAAVINGTEGPDELVGTPGADIIRGFQNNDRLFGRGGPDRLFAGSGHDYLVGNFGDDWLYGKPGRDTLIGGAGSDHLFGGASDDTLWVTGDSRGDVARCGAGDDTVYFDEIDTVDPNCENQIGPIQETP